MAEGTTTIISLPDALPHFLGSLRKLIEMSGNIAVDHAAFGDLLEFKSLVAIGRKQEEPWQELWERPELLWSGPDTLLQSVPLFIDLCDELLTTDCNSSLLAAAVQAHLAVFRGWLEHATPAQRAQLTADRCMRLLGATAGAAFEAFPLLSVVYDIQEALVDFGPALLRLALFGTRQLGKEIELQELPAVGHTLLQAATDALWLTSTIMHITSSPRLTPSKSQLSGIVHGLSEWARLLKGAEACAWWQQDPVSLELPMLLAELTLAHCERQSLSSQQWQATLDGQPELLAIVMRGALRFMQAELEKCLQTCQLQESPEELPCLERCSSLLASECFEGWLLDCTKADESMLDLWVNVLSLADEAEAQAQQRLSGKKPLLESWHDQMKALFTMRVRLAFLHQMLLKAFWPLNARAAQLLETAALKCATAAVWALRTARAFSCPEPGIPVFGGEELPVPLVGTIIILAGYLKPLASMGGPASLSPAALQPGALRPPGALAVAAALDAVRLGEAVLRCALGECRETLLGIERANIGLQCSPATLCHHALNIISKWATGKLSAASGSQPGLYLLQLTRGQSGLDALLSLLATQRKLAQQVAQGLQLAAGEAVLEDLHTQLWSCLHNVTLVGLHLASSGGSSRGGSGSSGGGSGGGLRISREKEAVVCLAIPTAMYLASAISTCAAATDLFTSGTPMYTAFMGTNYILRYCNCQGMTPSALRLGGGLLLNRIFSVHLELQPSPRKAADAAVSCVALFALNSDLLPAGAHGGLLRRAVEVYLAWLRADAFQVVKGNKQLLQAMETRFLEVCEAAEEHAGLYGVSPLMVQWAQLLMGRDYDFLKRFPRTKKERAQAKEKLINGWGLRAQHVCTSMERAARDVVHAELAPAERVKFISELSHRPLVGSQAPTSLAATINAAARAASLALVRAGVTAITRAAEDSAARKQIRGSAEADAAVPLGLRQAAEAVAGQEAESPHGQLLLPTAQEQLQEVIGKGTACAEPAQTAQPAAAHEGSTAVEAAEGTPGSGGSTPAVTCSALRPTAKPMASCPLMVAVRDIAVSRAGCANVCCSNLSGASESELPRLLCKGCLSACYCSEACRREDWHRHGSICRLVRLMRLDFADCKRATGNALIESYM